MPNIELGAGRREQLPLTVYVWVVVFFEEPGMFALLKCQCRLVALVKICKAVHKVYVLFRTRNIKFIKNWHDVVSKHFSIYLISGILGILDGPQDILAIFNSNPSRIDAWGWPQMKDSFHRQAVQSHMFL